MRRHASQSDPSQAPAPFSDEVERLASSAIDLARASILAENHFLASALARLQEQPAKLGVPFATDGFVLAYDCDQVLAAFKRDRGPAQHDLLHSIVHCLFLHPYAGDVEPALWNLACDIACERVVAELLGPRPGERGIALAHIVRQVERDTGCRADAERLYRELIQGRWSQKAGEWATMTSSDSHELWYAEADSPCDYTADASSSGKPEGRGDNPREGTEGSSTRDAADEGDDGVDWSSAMAQGGDERARSGNRGNARGGCGFSPSKGQLSRPSSSRLPATGSPSVSSIARPPDANASPSASGPRADRLRARDDWRDEATSLSVNLQTLSAGRGGRLVEFLADLQATLRSADDYASFLRSFSALGEVMRLSDEEFDYNFYDLGLRLYGDTPLIEPLEYREDRRIREFVIVIDTSESVQGHAVRSFVQTTFDMLKGSESFFDSVQVRVLQCDERVLSDDVIVDVDDMGDWARQLVVRGGGGTDFRPAFEYVGQLIDDGALRHVDGMLYFTDGLGVYPSQAPSYKTAFVFYDEDLVGDEVPPWAMRVVLDEGALRQAGLRAAR